jgi:disintegrin and metalloproteinase domain-containing protein 17
MICRYLKAFAKKVEITHTKSDIRRRGGSGGPNKVCLAHLFTHKDFPNGILGLAHIGRKKSSSSSESSTEESMGICAKGKRDKHGAYLNTALTTSLNWGRKIITAEADLVTAHELG